MSTEKIDAMPNCPNCGKETPADAAFCPFCGTSLTAVPPSQSQTTPPPPPPAVAEVPISYLVQTATIPFDEKASRLELLVRILWYFLAGIVGFVYSLIFGIIIAVYGIVALILNIINFFKILITGKRWKTAFNWQAKLITKSATYYSRLYNYWMRRAPYFGLMRDKRPDLGMEPETSKTPGGSPA
ncbi:MAG: zinc-ribbon domain-containing protein [Candidatus Bathyarchaeia archaeon]